MNNRRGWPSTLVMIADIIGDTSAQILAERLGGTRVRIPYKPREESLLVQAIGRSAAEALAHSMAGAEIDIPTGAILRSKKSAILRAIEQGLGTRDIAREYGVTQRYVRYLKSPAA